MKAVVLFILIGFGVSGCAKFSCGQYPQTGCSPVSENYDDTNGDLHDYRHDFNKENNKENKNKKRGRPDINVSSGNKSLNYAHPGDPILTPPRVLRVLVTPWEDKKGDLHAGGYIFLKVESSQWVVK